MSLLSCPRERYISDVENVEGIAHSHRYNLGVESEMTIKSENDNLRRVREAHVHLVEALPRRCVVGGDVDWLMWLTFSFWNDCAFQGKVCMDDTEFLDA